MLLESVSSTCKRAEELLNNISENIHNMETPIHVENYFSGQCLGILIKYLTLVPPNRGLSVQLNHINSHMLHFFSS